VPAWSLSSLYSGDGGLLAGTGFFVSFFAAVLACLAGAGAYFGSIFLAGLVSYFFS